MVRDHPLFGVGPNMVEVVYGQYRIPEAVEQVNPHLHNVPMQIAAERGQSLQFALSRTQGIRERRPIAPVAETLVKDRHPV